MKSIIKTRWGKRHPLLRFSVLQQYTRAYFLYSLWRQAREVTDSRFAALRVVLFVLSGYSFGFNAAKLETLVRRNQRLAFYKAFHHLEPHLVLCDDERKILYLPIPRAASSSILAYMLRRDQLKEQLADSRVQTIQDRQLIQRYAAAGYFIFSFVRNPYARLVSFFQQKYSFDAQAGVYLAQGFNALKGLRRVHSFADLVHRIQYIPDSVIDRHLLPQASILFPFPSYKKLVNYVGKIENLADDFAVITKQYDDRPFSLRINESKQTQMKKAFYNRQLADIVYKKYEMDFIEFGYSRWDIDER